MQFIYELYYRISLCFVRLFNSHFEFNTTYLVLHNSKLYTFVLYKKIAILKDYNRTRKPNNMSLPSSKDLLLLFLISGALMHLGSSLTLYDWTIQITNGSWKTSLVTECFTNNKGIGTREIESLSRGKRSSRTCW